jgi:hypothetical protein
MRDFRKQRSGTHEVFNFFLLCGGVAAVSGLAILSAHAAWDMYAKFGIASRADEASKTELAQLKGQYANVSQAVENLSTPRGEEGEIRERFGVAKPGEGAIQIVRTSTSSDGGQNQLPQDFLSRVLRALVVW